MISFSVLINIFVFSSIAIILLKIVFRNDYVVLRQDVRFIMICLILIMLRLFIPIESPRVSRIPVFRVYPDIYRFLRRPLFFVDNGQVSFLRLLVIMWIIGAVIMMLSRVYSYYSTVRRVKSYKGLVDKEFDSVLKKINAEYAKSTEFRLVVSEDTDTAYIFGIIKPYIVIPEGVEWNRQEIYFILKHEVLHFYRGDILIRALCEILKAVYWWNPFIYMLGRLVVNMQEINVDFKVIKGLPGVEQLDYSDCLIKVARDGKKRREKKGWEMGFRKESPSVIHKRISLMLKSLKIDRKRTVASLMLSIVILCLINLCPSVFIFEPYSKVEADTEGTIGVREGNIYYIKNSDDTYDIYINNEYYKTVLEVFDEKVPVYYNLNEQ